MRILVVAAIASASLAAGCSNPCQELGDRLCDCRTPGTTKASCTDAVRSEIERLHPGSSANDSCSKALDTCHSAGNVDFCDWLEGRCGKAACGMSEEDIKVLQGTAAACQTEPPSPEPPPSSCGICPK